MDKQCALCARPWDGKGSKCNTCKAKLHRAKATEPPPVFSNLDAILDEVIGPMPKNISTPTKEVEYIQAIELDVPRGLSTKDQLLAARKLNKKATRRQVSGSYMWVIPGTCPSTFDGTPTSCLNPSCSYFQKTAS
jgi:hypothetical protein